MSSGGLAWFVVAPGGRRPGGPDAWRCWYSAFGISGSQQIPAGPPLAIVVRALLPAARRAWGLEGLQLCHLGGLSRQRSLPGTGGRIGYSREYKFHQGGLCKEYYLKLQYAFYF